MPQIVIPFGAGLDRYTGVQRVQPGSMDDLLNVRPLGVKLQARNGMVRRLNLPDQGGQPCTAVLLVKALQSQQSGVVVAFHAATRHVHIYRVSGIGTDPQHVALWFTLHSDAASPPVITAAESYGLLVLAHNETRAVLRATTQVYDAVAGTVEPLRANLDRGGMADVRFAGVEHWRNYIAGWGWASPSEIRPEIVRISLPGEPTTFDPEHYFQAGDRGSPVTSVKPAGSTLLSLKPSETYNIIGTSQEDFGILPLYALFGCLSARLAITVEGLCYIWGFEGPWVFTGSSSADLESMLDIERLAPELLPNATSARTAFAVYIPGERVIEWHWGSRIYALSLESGGVQWSYRTRGRPMMSGGLLYSAGESVIAPSGEIPVGYASVVSVTPDERTATVTFSNQDHTGSEILETWLKEGENGEWRKVDPDIRITVSPEQEVMLRDLDVGTEYTVALRYRLLGEYGTAYLDPDPDSWPRPSRHTFTMDFGGETAPTIDSLVWMRTSTTAEHVLVRFTPRDPSLSHQVIRALGPSPSTLEPGVTEYRDTGISGEATFSYFVRAVVGDLTSSLSPLMSIWTGPLGVTTVSVEEIEPSPISSSIVRWEYAGADLLRNPGVQIRVDGVIQTLARGARSLILVGTYSSLRIRTYIEHFGVTDYGQWVDVP